MKIVRLLIVGIVISLAGANLRAQPATRPTTVPADEKPLPELRFDSVAFDDVIDFLRDVSNVNIVVRRGPGVPADYPKLDKIRLTNISVRQFFDFLRTTYDLPVQRIEGPGGAMYSIKINAGNVPNSAQLLSQVRVFDLSEAINGIKSRRPNDAKGDPLADTLSLLQLVLDQSGEQPKPTLTVHQATQTLIFKGSFRSTELVDDTLRALKSGRYAGDLTRTTQSLAREYNQRASEANTTSATNALGSADQILRLNQLEAENVRLREQLEKSSQTPSTK